MKKSNVDKEKDDENILLVKLIKYKPPKKIPELERGEPSIKYKIEQVKKRGHENHIPRENVSCVA